MFVEFGTWVVQRRYGRSLSLSRSIVEFSFNREFCWNRIVYLLFWDLNLISMHDSGRPIVWAKVIENIKKTSARRFVTRRSSSRRSRSRRLGFLDDLSSIYLGDRYVFSPLLSFAGESRICGLFDSPLPRKVHVFKHPVRSVPQFWTSCVAVCDVWWWPVSSPCSPLLVVSYRCERQMLASSRTHFCQVVYVQKNHSAWESRISGWFVFRFPHIIFILSDVFFCEMTLPSVASCDFARTHPPFLASSRPHQNLRNEPWFFVLRKTDKFNT